MIVFRSAGFTSQMHQDLLQIGGQWCATFDPHLCHWVHESQYPGMQRLSVKPGQPMRQRRALAVVATSAISKIAQQRMSHSCHVDADLMRTAGMGADLNQGVSSKAFQYTKFGDGLAPNPRLRGHFLSVDWMPAHGSVDHPLCLPKITTHDGQIPFLHQSLGELPCEATVGRIIFRHHDDPRGVLIESMYNARALDATDS